MNERRDLRASDGDRQAAVERLRAAHDEGRLDLHEYDTRLQRAYQSVTYGDIADLFVDLPVAPPTLARSAASNPSTIPARPAVATRSGLIADMPIALKILWTIWLSAACIILTVWFLVNANNGGEDFWPMWFAVPGVALLGVTVGVTSIRRTRRAARLARAARRR